MRLEVHPTTPQPRIIKKTVDVLKRGGTIAYPTDTVYAVGCDIFEKKALNRVYQIKQMDKSHPVAFVCAHAYCHHTDTLFPLSAVSPQPPASSLAVAITVTTSG